MLAPPDKSVEVEPQAHAVASQRRPRLNCPASQLGPKLKKKKEIQGRYRCNRAQSAQSFHQSVISTSPPHKEERAHRKHLKSFCRVTSERIDEVSCRWKA